MHSGPQSQFSIQEAVRVSRWLTNFLTSTTKENWFKEQGIFRLSGTQKKAQEIVENILQNQYFDTHAYSRDDYISALKFVLNNCTLLPTNDTDVVQLNAILNVDNINTPEQNAQASTDLQKFIDKLARSYDYNKMAFAEILYNYLTLLYLSQQQSETNKMTAHNLSIILAPLISKTLGLVDPRADIKLQNVCEPLITSDEYLIPYFRRYREEVKECYVIHLRREYKHVRGVYENLLAKKQEVDSSIQNINGEIHIQESMLESLNMSHDKQLIKNSEFREKSKLFQEKLSDLNAQLLIEKINQEALYHELELVKRQINDLEIDINSALMQSMLPLDSFAPLPTEVELKELPLVAIEHLLTEPDMDDGSFCGSPLSATSLMGSPDSSPLMSREPSPERRSSLLFQAPSVSIAATQAFKLALDRAKCLEPKKVIDTLIDSLRAEFTAKEIAKFIFNHKNELNAYQKELGDALSKQDDFSNQLLKAYTDNFDFTGKNFAVALREYLESGGFVLPGEAQKLDRIVKAFAERYYQNNQAVFPSMPTERFQGSDKVYGLAFGTVMLNTDLHNPAIRHKMTKDEFLRNLSDYNIDKGFLKSIYTEIKRHEIQLPKAQSKSQTAAMA
ncbi:MAG: hypothetical protein JSR17_09325 [Proteobacteria bacterium]|nr:hypothetical protein [Pseudomonadota bacterium]